MYTKLTTALIATACSSNAIKITVSKDAEDVADEMQAFAEGMTEHLLYTGESTDRDGNEFIDLRNEDDSIIQSHVVEYINEILEREDPDQTDMEQMGLQNLLDQLIGEGDEEDAKRLMAEAVTDYFRNNGDYYIGKNAEGIRVALQDQIACQLDEECEDSDESVEPPSPTPVDPPSPTPIDPPSPTPVDPPSPTPIEPPSPTPVEPPSPTPPSPTPVEPPSPTPIEPPSPTPIEPPSPTPIEPPTPTPPPVPTKRTYTVYQENKTWGEANHFCKQNHKDLAVITNGRENEAVWRLTAQQESHYWIGLTDQGREGDWGWSDGTKFDFPNWQYNEPNNYWHGEGEDCGAFGDKMTYPRDKWNDMPCDATLPFVCYDMTVEEVMPSKPKFFIPKDPSNKDIRSNFHQSNEVCKQHGGTLASIHNEEEREEVYSMINPDNRWWIGLERAANGQFNWVDGSALDYTYWAPNEPNNYGGDEDCGAIWNYRGKWNDYRCNWWGYFICRIDNYPDNSFSF